MSTRTPRVAGAFYPGSAAEIRQQVTQYRQQIDLNIPTPVYGAIVPHAGWAFSGLTAAHAFAALTQQEAPNTFVLFGAVHAPGVHGPSLYASGSWRTPLGSIEVDGELADAILAQGEPFVDRPAAHADEHSLEVQVPFIQVLFPQAKILPIAVPPAEAAPAWGSAVAQVVLEKGRSAVALGSSDLTHYGPRYGLAPAGLGEKGKTWAEENDARLLDLLTELRTDQVVDMALERHNACGPGAIAAAMGFAEEMGATRGRLLHYVTSHDVMPMGEPADLVGYAAVAFLRG